MVTYFNKKDLVSFGVYLLSDERKANIQESFDQSIKDGIKNPIPAEESAKFVHGADIRNWKEKRK